MSISIIRKSLTGLSVDQYYQKHLHIINQFLPIQLTKKEIEVLAGFMSLKGDLTKQDRFGTQARKIIMEKLDMSSGGLGNHLKSLKNNDFIIINSKGKLEINSYLVADENQQGYQFKIVKKDE